MHNTFVFRRWHNEAKGYVDSNNRILTTPVIDRKPQLLSLPSIPPADGSSPFLTIPTELRLNIYKYLTVADEANNQDTVFTPHSFVERQRTKTSSTRYAYVYRSPGRMTKSNAVSKEMIILLHVCHQMREELLDSCFDDRVFILEASLYCEDAAGLRMLPSALMPSAWVRYLLILTAVELDGWPKGLADLRPLQQMTNLKEVRIVFTARKRCKGHSNSPPGLREDHPIKAIVQCIPRTAKVQLDMNEGIKTQLLADLGPGIGYLFESSETEAALETLQAELPTLNSVQGRLSGRNVDTTKMLHLPSDDADN
jgi:hypothetical protein